MACVETLAQHVPLTPAHSKRVGRLSIIARRGDAALVIIRQKRCIETAPALEPWFSALEQSSIYCTRRLIATRGDDFRHRTAASAG